MRRSLAASGHDQFTCETRTNRSLHSRCFPERGRHAGRLPELFDENLLPLALQAAHYRRIAIFGRCLSDRTFRSFRFLLGDSGKNAVVL